MSRLRQSAREVKDGDLSRSMEVDYHDLMSTEIDELASVSVVSLEAHHNQLSSISPFSP
jgi:hypothetical protein